MIETDNMDSLAKLISMKILDLFQSKSMLMYDFILVLAKGGKSKYKSASFSRSSISHIVFLQESVVCIFF
jgi:hypothetical protein